MQKILVIITLLLAIGYLLKTFVWDSIVESKGKTSGTMDGGKTKCGKHDCGCH